MEGGLAAPPWFRDVPPGELGCLPSTPWPPVSEKRSALRKTRIMRRCLRESLRTANPRRGPDMPLSKQSEPSKPPPWVVTHFRLVVIWILLLAGLLFVFWLRPPERIMPNPEVHAGVGKPLSYLELRPLTGGPRP